MTESVGSRQFRERIVGRTISGVIARRGRKGEPPVVMMLRFEDGGVVEFVSPRSDRLLEDAVNQSLAECMDWQAGHPIETGAQLPLAGLFGAAAGADTGSAMA